MSKLSNDQLLEMAKDITIAVSENCSMNPVKANDNQIADFLEVIYTRLSDLNKD